MTIEFKMDVYEYDRKFPVGSKIKFTNHSKEEKTGTICDATGWCEYNFESHAGGFFTLGDGMHDGIVYYVCQEDGEGERKTDKNAKLIVGSAAKSLKDWDALYPVGTMITIHRLGDQGTEEAVIQDASEWKNYKRSGNAHAGGFFTVSHREDAIYVAIQRKGRDEWNDRNVEKIVAKIGKKNDKEPLMGSDPIDAAKKVAYEWNICDPDTNIPMEAAKQIAIAAITEFGKNFGERK